MSNPTTDPRPDATPIACTTTGDFQPWLERFGGSLALTTYQAGKVAIVGTELDPSGNSRLSLLLRDFDKPMGLAVSGSRMALATRNEVLELADAPLLAPDYLENGPRYDALFLPRVSHFTGDLNVHDVAYADDGLWIVNTRFCCLAQLNEAYSFVPRWKPSFVTDIVPEDRCHLNGLAIVDGRPKYVTALGTTNAPGAWREQKATGGVVIDIGSGEIIARGLSMPHSPRWHDGRLWVLNSGAGELAQVNLRNGQLEVVTALPGYLRGLCFAGSFALVGMCQIRERHIFGGLPVQTRFKELNCGVAVIDLARGQPIGAFLFTSGVQELFQVQLLPDRRKPMILNSAMEATRQAFTAPQFSYWLRPSSLVKDYA